MATLNKKKKTPLMSEERLAGGEGMKAAIQSDENALKRLVLTCLLWEDNAYIDGQSIVQEIKTLIPKVSPKFLSSLAISARKEQKLRHIPLLLVREMCRYPTTRPYVEATIKEVITRPDQMTELLKLYWSDNNGKKSLPAAMKRGLASVFYKFDEYQLAKWNRKNEVKLADVMKLVHPIPDTDNRSQLWKSLLDGTIATPDTWEVAISKCTTKEEKNKQWTRLVEENKLGALAFLKNIRNMVDVGVKSSVIRKGLKNVSPTMLLPIDFIRAADNAHDYNNELSELMERCCNQFKKLSGHTIFVLDVSGSMTYKLSSKSEYNRMDVGMAMAMLASYICESFSIYLTAGSDPRRIHKTIKIANNKGFGLRNDIRRKVSELGGGGIFTRQCLEYIKEKESETPDRIIVFSDSQDMDGSNKIPKPFGKTNYIIDVSSHQNGINYKGVWTSEISGYSEKFLQYISELENGNQ